MSQKEVANETNITATGSIVLRLPRADGEGAKVRLYVNATALTGTAPTVDFTLTKVLNGATKTFAPTPAWAQVTAGGGTQVVEFDDVPDDPTLNYTLGGTVTDFDYSVWAERI